MRAMMSGDMVRWCGLVAVVVAVGLVAGNLSFWLLVPENDARREERETLVFLTAVVWLITHALMTVAIAGIYSQVYRRVGVFGGAGAVMAFWGTIGLVLYVFFLFPELVGFRPDTFHDAQVALAIQAIGELGVFSLLAGMLLLCLTMIVTRAFAPYAAAIIAAGCLIAPFALADLAWLAVGACVIATGVAWIGVLLVMGRTPVARSTRESWPPPTRAGQFRF